MAFDDSTGLILEHEMLEYDSVFVDEDLGHLIGDGLEL